jgi:hypothetical protein
VNVAVPMLDGNREACLTEVDRRSGMVSCCHLPVRFSFSVKKGRLPFRFVGKGRVPAGLWRNQGRILRRSPAHRVGARAGFPERGEVSRESGWSYLEQPTGFKKKTKKKTSTN